MGRDTRLGSDTRLLESVGYSTRILSLDTGKMAGDTLLGSLDPRLGFYAHYWIDLKDP